MAAEFLSLRRWQGLEIISQLVCKKGAWGAWARHSFDASGGWRFWHDGPDRQGPRTTNADNAVDITNEPLCETQWLIQDRLETGIVYTWMVTALKDAQEIIAPASPARA